MPKQKTKKIVTPECDLQVPAEEVDVAPVSAMQAKDARWKLDSSSLAAMRASYTDVMTGQPVFDGVTDAPYQENKADTDMQKRIQDEIDSLYPRTRLGTEGILDAILRELIRARLCR